jgi:hypothetical protein
MKTGMISLVAALVMLGLPVSAAAVNCAQVNKYLSTGRSVTDIAETMIIPEAEVKKCQQEAAAGGATAPSAAPTPAAAKTK